MIKKITLLLFIITLFTNAFTQVIKTPFNITPLGEVNLIDKANVIDTISVIKLAPSPALENDINAKKRLIEAKRLEYLTQINRRTVFESTLPIAPNMPYVERGFTDSLFTSGVPNDNHLAVNNAGDVISVLNSNIRIYKAETNLTYSVALTYFARIEPKNTWPQGRPRLTGSYDPKALYDPINDRFVVTWLDGRVSFDTRIMVATSKTSDPTGAWTIYQLPGNPLKDKSWTDYPIMSMSKDDIFITVNLLKDSASWQEAFKQSVIWQIDKQGIYTSDTLKTTLWSDISYNSKAIWSICPADQYYKSTSNEMFFLSVRPSDLSNDTLFLHKINNTQASDKAQFSFQILKTPQKYGLPGSAYQPQKDFRLQTNDARVLTASYQYGNIRYAQNCINHATFAPSVMLGYITDMQNPVLQNHLISSDSLDLGYPSLAYMGNGTRDNTAVVTFSHSSVIAFPGVSMVKIDEKGIVSPIIRVKTGAALINSFVPDSLERWGDYSGLQRKYNEEGVGFLANSVGVINKQTAGTYIAKIKMDKKTIVFNENIFPNPSGDGIFYFSLKLSESTKFKLLIYSLDDGKKMIEKEQEITDLGDLVIRQDLSFLSNGSYSVKWIRLSDNKVFLDQKVQKY